MRLLGGARLEFVEIPVNEKGEFDKKMQEKLLGKILKIKELQSDLFKLSNRLNELSTNHVTVVPT